MSMKCESAAPLVPIYMDGELTEARAAPLRRHLLECHACRSLAQAETALKGWFVESSAGSIEVPPGFAARVARRAFAGDEGLVDATIGQGDDAPMVLTPVHAGERPMLQFLLQVTAVAAALLIALTIGMHRGRVPEIDSLQASDEGTLEQVLERLDSLNRREATEAERELASDPQEKGASEEDGEK